MIIAQVVAHASKVPQVGLRSYRIVPERMMLASHCTAKLEGTVDVQSGMNIERPKSLAGGLNAVRRTDYDISKGAIERGVMLSVSPTLLFQLDIKTQHLSICSLNYFGKICGMSGENGLTVYEYTVRDMSRSSCQKTSIVATSVG